MTEGAGSIGGSDERRAAAFALWFDQQTCTRIELWRWGTVFVDAEFPNVSDSNFLSIDHAPIGQTVDRIVAEAERARGEAGIPQRRVVVGDPKLAARLCEAFESAGWRADRYRLMVQRRVPETAADAPAAGEVSFPELMRFREELEAETSEASEPLRTRRAYAEKIHRAIGTRCFLAWSGGRAVSGCVLWIHGDDALLDAVATLPAFRGRGAAGSVIRAAVDAAHAAEASWVHLYTHAQTGPIALYRRLGFDDVSDVTEFVAA
jgi:GNAT superfamily N-acetyltransferase